MKKYIYLAVDKNGEIILNKYEKPLFSPITGENNEIRWDFKNIEGYKKEDIQNKYKEEVKKPYKEKEIEQAKDRLFQKVEDKTMNRATKKGNILNNCEEVKEVTNHLEEDIKTSLVKSEEKIINDINSTVDQTGEYLNTTLKKFIEEKIEKIREFIRYSKKEISQDIYNVNKDISKKINDCNNDVKKNQQDISYHAKNISKNIKKNEENIMKKQCEISEYNNKLIKKLDNKVENLTETLELIETINGKTKKLDQLDEITKVLTSENLDISREIPPINADEQDILNLVKYSQKISEQLGYAARELIRKKDFLKGEEEKYKNQEKIIEDKISDSRKEGIEEGKLEVIKSLLFKFTDFDSVIESENEQLHLIWPMLQDLG
ncbi:hypothetical protein, partial [Intestinibacter sp.]